VLVSVLVLVLVELVSVLVPVSLSLLVLVSELELLEPLSVFVLVCVSVPVPPVSPTSSSLVLPPFEQPTSANEKASTLAQASGLRGSTSAKRVMAKRECGERTLSARSRSE